MKLTLLGLCLCVSIAACAPVVPPAITEPSIQVPLTNTAVVTAIQTITPVPAPSITPTLEAWMQSLPESVLTIEKDGNKIFGLDAERKRVREFNLETGEWALTPDGVMATLRATGVDVTGATVKAE